MKKSRKRRLLAGLLAAALSLPLLFLPAGAVGDGNIDGGNGGGMGAGSKQNYWNNEDGVRITILKNGQKVYQMDWSNQPEAPSVKRSFVPRNKLDYLHGDGLAYKQNQYTCTVVPLKMPTIIGGAGGSNIDAIRRYFTDKAVMQSISNGVGIPYDALTGGEYKLLLEPIAYFVFQGTKWAMTATEAAMYDAQVDGKLRAWMKSLTHQNLPLSMFLERNDTELHLEAWTGSKSGKQSNANIIHYLGMGIVSFTPQLPPVQDTYDYEFRTDTDVIVAFSVPNNLEGDVTPDHDAYVDIDLNGQLYQVSYICPAGGTQLVWVKWHTPKDPVQFKGTATCSRTMATVELNINVTKLEEQTPPDPTFFDRGGGFTLQDVPNYGSNLSTTWVEWHARWIKVGIHGWWSFYTVTYGAKLYIRDFKLTPDARCPTAYQLANGKTTMKSGYAVEVSVEPLVQRGNRVADYDVTGIQNGVATFPEFGYEEYDRLLEKVDSRHWSFKKNPFSYYGNRIHYTPLWYPDNVDYPVAVCVFDAWTPGGQLYATLSGSVDIFDACLNDWYIHETDEED